MGATSQGLLGVVPQWQNLAQGGCGTLQDPQRTEGCCPFGVEVFIHPLTPLSTLHPAMAHGRVLSVGSEEQMSGGAAGGRDGVCTYTGLTAVTGGGAAGSGALHRQESRTTPAGISPSQPSVSLFPSVSFPLLCPTREHSENRCTGGITEPPRPLIPGLNLVLSPDPSCPFECGVLTQEPRRTHSSAFQGRSAPTESPCH